MAGSDVEKKAPRPIWLATQWTLFDCLRISLLSCIVVYWTFGLYTSCYHAFITRFGSERWFFIATTVAIHESLYYGFNAFLWWLSRSEAADAHRLPRQDHQQPSAQLVRKTLMQSAVSHWLVQPLSLYLLYPILASRMTISPQPLSFISLATVAAQFAASVLINDARTPLVTSSLFEPGTFPGFPP